MKETKIIRDKAETIYVQHPEASYAIFCFNSYGDLFMNSDWGTCCYAWRAFGENFKEFLKKTEADYIISKFAINWNFNNKEKFGGNREKHITTLVNMFLTELQKEEFPESVTGMPISPEFRRQFLALLTETANQKIKL